MYKKIIVYLFLFQLFASLQAQNIQLVFRYDDFLLTSDSLKEGVVNTFQKHHIPIVLGVIPCNKSEQLVLEPNYPFLSTLRQGSENKTIEIALHGLTHQKIADGEFANVDAAEQLRRLTKGKQLLDSVLQTSVVSFIPPWNAYDATTLNVLAKLGFKTISSAMCINQPSTHPALNYYPHTIGSLSLLLDALQSNKNREGVVVVMFHSYDFEKTFTLQQLDEILTQVSGFQYVKCTTFSQLNANKQVVDDRRITANLEINLLTKKLKSATMIQTTRFSENVRIANVSMYILICSIAFFLFNYLFRLKITKIHFLLLPFCCAFIGIIVFFHVFSPMKSMVAAVLIVFFVNLFLKFGLAYLNSSRLNSLLKNKK